MDIHLDLLRYLIAEIAVYPTHIAVGEEDRVYAQRLVAIKGVTQEETLVGIHIGGRRDKRWLIEHFAALSDRLMIDAGAKAIGGDIVSADSPTAISEGAPAHKRALAAGMPIFEALVNLKEVVGRRFLFIGLPLRIEGGEASPIRAVALISRCRDTSRQGG